MIQRIQTVWLMLSAALILAVPGAFTPGFIWIFIIPAVIVPIAAVFLFSRRKMQKLLAAVAILFDLAFSVYSIVKLSAFSREEVIQMNNLLRIILPLGAAITALLAIWGINRDERLVRSYDRLR